jgi:thiosulfate/3-mercaptopyruvate sulfurtransferase
LHTVFRYRVVTIALNSLSVLLLTGSAIGSSVTDPWTKAQLISPESLNKRLAETEGAKPLIIYVGFRPLYVQGHIPGAVYYGPAARPEGLAELRRHLRELPRPKEIILYCGCCPWHECPNIRPAFQALKEMGFTRFKVLHIPNRLSADWAAKGYPLEKGE